MSDEEHDVAESKIEVEDEDGSEGVKQEQVEEEQGSEEGERVSERVSEGVGEGVDEGVSEEVSDGRLRIVEQGLNFLLKDFGAENGGEFHGLIISYDEPFFKVVYEDGDEEEMDVEEAERLLVSRDDMSPATVAALKKVAKQVSSKNSDVVEQEVVEEELEEGVQGVIISNDDVENWKYFVIKSFDQGDFFGLIVGFEEPFYKVVYEDGDHEELELEEVRNLVISPSDVDTTTKEHLRGVANSMLASASPSDFTPNVSSSKKKSINKGNVRVKGKGNAKGKSDNKVKGGGDGDDKDEGVTVRVTPAGVQDFNYFVLKSFGSWGNFNGLVINYEKPFYKVVYEDEDEEEFKSSELRAILVPPASVPPEKQATLRAIANAKTTTTPTSDSVDTNSARFGESSRKRSFNKSSSSGKKNKSKKAKSNGTSNVVASTPPASGTKAVVELRLQEPVDSYDNYVTKTFFGFGEFYGLVVSCQGPYYKVLYSDGDSEELSRAEVVANLTKPDDIPAKIRNMLRTHSREYKKNPDPYVNAVLCVSPTDNAPISNYRNVPEDNVYQQYVGRSFIDTDENITFRVKSVCLHKDYDVLLFKYYDEYQFLCNPEYFDDQDKYECSACSEMLKADSWCKWIVEQQPDANDENEDEKGDEDKEENDEPLTLVEEATSDRERKNEEKEQQDFIKPMQEKSIVLESEPNDSHEEGTEQQASIQVEQSQHESSDTLMEGDDDDDDLRL